MHVEIVGMDLFPIDIHLRDIQDLFRKINAFSDDSEKCCINAGHIQHLEDHVGTKQHDDRIVNRHGSVEVEVKRCTADRHSREFTDQHLHTDRRDRRKFRTNVIFCLSFDRLIQTCIILLYQMVISDFGNTLDIFQNDADDISVRSKFFVCHLRDAFVRKLIHEKEHRDTTKAD